MTPSRLRETEYKDIPSELLEKGVLTKSDADVMREMAGYRNRMVHFYHEISSKELYEICANETGDIEKVLAEILEWVTKHPEMVDHEL